MHCEVRRFHHLAETENMLSRYQPVLYADVCMFSGRGDEARASYYETRIMPADADRNGRRVILDDFKALSLPASLTH